MATGRTMETQLLEKLAGLEQLLTEKEQMLEKLEKDIDENQKNVAKYMGLRRYKWAGYSAKELEDNITKATELKRNINELTEIICHIKDINHK